MEEEKPWSVFEAAKFLGVKPVTVRAWVAQRRITHYKLGRRIILHQADLAEFKARHRVEAVTYD